MAQAVDQTLLLLYSSATTKGVAHKVTRNLAYLVDSHVARSRPLGAIKWDPRRKSYEPTKPKSKSTSPRRAELERNAWFAVGETVRMAEGMARISLGRLRTSK
jgi:hypothetical protein